VTAPGGGPASAKQKRLSGSALARIRRVLARLKVPLSWSQILKRAVKEFIADGALDLGAQQAYYFFFALFPALLTLISIASFFPVVNLADETIRALRPFVSPEVLKIFSDQLAAISDSNKGGILTFAFLLTVWTSSGAMVSIITTLNAAYDITEGRPWWKVRLTAILLTLGIALFILTSISLVLVGPAVAERLAVGLGLGNAFKWAWWILQWPLILALVATGVGLIYYFAPDAEQEWVWITPGSVIATMLWLALSLLFRWYVANFGSYNETYGSIGAIIVLLTWLYLTGLAILFGAEINSEIEHASPHGKNPGEKVVGELGAGGAKRASAGGMDITPLPADVNCDLDEELSTPPRSPRVSDLVIGAAALLPAIVRVGRKVREEVKDRD
jgi:membrane protein